MADTASHKIIVRFFVIEFNQSKHTNHERSPNCWHASGGSPLCFLHSSSQAARPKDLPKLLVQGNVDDGSVDVPNDYHHDLCHDIHDGNGN